MFSPSWYNCLIVTFIPFLACEAKGISQKLQKRVQQDDTASVCILSDIYRSKVSNTCIYKVPTKTIGSKFFDFSRITCSNQTSSNSKSIVVATQGSASYKDNIACVFGAKQLQNLLEMKPEYITNIKNNIFKGLSQEDNETQESINIKDVEIDLSEDSNDAENRDDSIFSSQKSQGYKNIVNPVEFTGFISSCAHGCGRSSTDRQFYYINSRPCEPTKIMRLINEIYRQNNSNQYPFVFLNVTVEKNTVDVNVTPDKRQVFLTREKFVLDVLKSTLLKLFENIPRTLKIGINNLFDNEPKDLKADVDQPRLFNSFLHQFSKQSTSRENTEKTVDLKRKSSTTMLDFISSKVKKASEPYKRTGEAKGEGINGKDIQEFSNDAGNSEDNTTDSSEFKESVVLTETINLGHLKEQISKSKLCNENKEMMYLEYTDNLPTTQIRQIDDVVLEKVHKISCKVKPSTSKGNISSRSPDEQPAKKSKVITDKEDLGKHNRKSVIMKTSLEHVKVLNEMYNKQKNKSAPERVKFKSAINPVFNKKCEEELSKEISKDSFKKMSIVGQFNLGFIITRLEDDLFIIDQHATDEIYNFETLQKTTELTNQKLVW